MKSVVVLLKIFFCDGQRVRSIVQIGFLLLVLWIGYEFYRFVGYHQQDLQGVTPERPPGVEAFLPISSLISLKSWFQTGVFNPIHPSGLVIFLIILALALLLKKSFCSWVCPVGFLSESFWQAGKKLYEDLSQPDPGTQGTAGRFR